MKVAIIYDKRSGRNKFARKGAVVMMERSQPPNFTFPKMYHIRQHFTCMSIEDIPSCVRNEFLTSGMDGVIKPGQKIAVAVGSRGITNIPVIVRAAVEELKRLGAIPFIVPAMGSHGGATDEGQEKVLRSLGITEESAGAPIVSHMDVVQVAVSPDGVPIYLDKVAAGADGIFVINRIKPHTDFDAPVESGLMKMIAIGLAKHTGCVTLHTHGLSRNIPIAADAVLSEGYIKGGLAIVENSREQTACLKVLKAEEFITKERELLVEAKRLMARLPIMDLDVLIVKEIGKTISGTGMDTNVIGRLRVEGLPEAEGAKIKRIVVLELSANSYGNALGIGLADLTTKKLVDSIDIKAMYANVISTCYLERGKIPIYLDTDQLAAEAALATIGPVSPENARICIIKNTLELEELFVSESLLHEITALPHIEVLNDVEEALFTDEGNLTLFK
jgi:hypothetical protein